MEETAIQARDRGYADGKEGKPPKPGHGDERAEAYKDGYQLGVMVGLAGPSPSAQLLESDRAEFFKKVEERAKEIGNSWAEVMGLIQRMEE